MLKPPVLQEWSAPCVAQFSCNNPFEQVQKPSFPRRNTLSDKPDPVYFCKSWQNANF